MRLLPSVAFALAAVLYASPPADAQCVPDGLDAGPCCGPAGANLPQFPPVMTDVRFICFDNCVPSLNNLYCANVGVPIPIQTGGAIMCGVYNIRIRLKTCGTNVFVWNGGVNAYYSRNWQESSVPGTVNLTVWRFVVNGDFAPLPPLPTSPCDRPGCLVQFSRVYFSGYIDYAFDCLSNTWRMSFALSHECDKIHHAPGTARPAPAAGSFHPTRSFSMVAPGSTFTVATAAGVQSNGPIIQEAMRWNDYSTAPQICRFEERAQGIFQAGNTFCFCAGPPPANPQYIDTMVSAQGACGSSVVPSPNGPFTQKQIGGWTSATAWPGQEFVLFDFGWLDTKNGCIGTGRPEWYEGGETIGGFPATDFAGVALGRQFEDLGSARFSFINPAVRIGAPHVCEYLLNFNLP